MGYSVIHAYLCVGNSNWYQSIKDTTLRPTIKLAIRLVCKHDGHDREDNVLITLKDAVSDFYHEFPEDKLSVFNSCLLDGIYKNLKGVVCSEKHEEFKESTIKVVYGLFQCDEETKTGFFCSLIKWLLDMVFSFVELKCEDKLIQREYFHEVLKLSSDILSDQQYSTHAPRLKKRQYDLLNMMKLIRHLTCTDSHVVAFGQTFFEKLNYDFLGEHDDFLLDFFMRAVANAGCCLISLVPGLGTIQ